MASPERARLIELTFDIQPQTLAESQKNDGITKWQYRSDTDFSDALFGGVHSLVRILGEKQHSVLFTFASQPVGVGKSLRTFENDLSSLIIWQTATLLIIGKRKRGDQGGHFPLLAISHHIKKRGVSFLSTHFEITASAANVNLVASEARTPTEPIRLEFQLDGSLRVLYHEATTSPSTQTVIPTEL